MESAHVLHYHGHLNPVAVDSLLYAMHLRQASEYVGLFGAQRTVGQMLTFPRPRRSIEKIRDTPLVVSIRI